MLDWGGRRWRGGLDSGVERCHLAAFRDVAPKELDFTKRLS